MYGNAVGQRPTVKLCSAQDLKLRYRTRIMTVVGKNPSIYKELLSISISPNSETHEIKDFLGVVGSLVIDDEKLAPVVKQLD